MYPRMGVQTYWGGQAVKIILGAVIGPKYAYMANTLPISANVDTCSLVSFFIFLAIFCPMLLVPPEKLQLPLKVRHLARLKYLILISKDSVCYDRMQYIWYANLVRSNCPRRWESYQLARNREWKSFELERGVRASSDSWSLERWHRWSIR
jgi:hypothetical protein